MIGDALWELAGPRLFAAEVERALTERVNVFAHSSDERALSAVAVGLRSALLQKQHYPQEGRLESWSGDWRELCRYCCAQGDTLEEYCTNLGAMSFLISANTAIDVKQIRDLLDRWQHATRKLPGDARPVLLLVGLCPADQKGLVKSDVALRPVDWDGFLSLADLEGFAWSKIRLSGRANHSTLRRVLARTVAEVSQGDADLAAFLCSRSPEEIATPETAVRKWLLQNESKAPESIFIEGKWVPHSGYALEKGRGAELIRKRVWYAQAGVLLPWVEEQRSRLVGSLTRRLSLVDSRNLTVSSVEELEVGEVWFQLKEQGRQDTAFSVFDRLREIRNKAAHGVVMPFTRLVDTVDLLSNVEAF